MSKTDGGCRQEYRTSSIDLRQLISGLKVRVQVFVGTDGSQNERNVVGAEAGVRAGVWSWGLELGFGTDETDREGWCGEVDCQKKVCGRTEALYMRADRHDSLVEKGRLGVVCRLRHCNCIRKWILAFVYARSLKTPTNQGDSVSGDTEKLGAQKKVYSSLAQRKH